MSPLFRTRLERFAYWVGYHVPEPFCSLLMFGIFLATGATLKQTIATLRIIRAARR